MDKLFPYSIFLSMALLSSAAKALPLLSENAATRVSEVFTVYPDHADPRKFYYFPNSGVLVRDSANMPLFTMVYYGLDDSQPDNGGGLLTAVFKLESNPAQRKAKEEFLRQNPQAGLAVLPVKASALNGGNFSFYRNLQLPPVGGRAEDEMGFTAELTEMGARFIRGQAEGSAGQQTSYCYKVDGYGPAMDADIRIEWQQVYDHFRASTSAGAFWWRVNITTEVEKLKQRNLVEVRINGGDAKMEEYVNKIVDMMITKLFVPSLDYNRGSNGTVFSHTPLQFNAGHIHREELKTFRGRFINRDLVEREACVTLGIKDVAPYFNDLVRSVD